MPSWKIQTSAPKLAVIESRVMITALIGMTIEPNSRNRISALATSVSVTAYGARSACETRKSWPVAALPPTWVVMPDPASTARMTGIMSVAAGTDGDRGLIASRRTVLPRTYCARSSSMPAGRWPSGSA